MLRPPARAVLASALAALLLAACASDVRVLENPTCRGSTWDAIRAGVEPRPDLHATIQERAWSSPIWTVP